MFLFSSAEILYYHNTATGVGKQTCTIDKSQYSHRYKHTNLSNRQILYLVTPKSNIKIAPNTYNLCSQRPEYMKIARLNL